ncbi:hypothetical protein GCM10018952_10010 [Streptosporangium vulgare]
MNDMVNDVVLVNCTVTDARAAVPGTAPRSRTPEAGAVGGEGRIVDAAVWVRGDRIAAVGPRERILERTGDARPIDLDGAYVTPGLVNMHTHLSLSLPGQGGDSVKNMTAHELALYMADGARRTLHCGVTTVRCVAEKDHADFALRRAIESGRAIGPRIFTAGRALVCTGGHGHEGSDTLECDGADGFRRGVRAQVKAGADLIKIMISGGIAGEHEKIDTPQLFSDEMAAALQTAHAWGRKVTAHAGPAAVIAEAVELGLDCVEHGYQLTPRGREADGRTRHVPGADAARHPLQGVLRRTRRAGVDAVPLARRRPPAPGELRDGPRRGGGRPDGQRHAAVLGLRGDQRLGTRAGVHVRGRPRPGGSAVRRGRSARCAGSAPTPTSAPSRSASTRTSSRWTPTPSRAPRPSAGSAG